MRMATLSCKVLVSKYTLESRPADRVSGICRETEMNFPTITRCVRVSGKQLNMPQATCMLVCLTVFVLCCCVCVRWGCVHSTPLRVVRLTLTTPNYLKEQ